MNGAFEPLAIRSRLVGARALVGTASRRAVFAVLARIERGRLLVNDGGERFTFGRGGDLSAQITIHDAAAYRALLLGGSVGAGEAFMNGLWSSDEPGKVARLFAKNAAVLDRMDSGVVRLPRFFAEVMAKAFRRNTRGGSRRNIAQHYDVSNDFFALFLDESMTYSCAIFDAEGATLEAAQVAKNERVCRELKLAPHDHLLEIGTGWGALAIHAAERYGCRVTTTTVSVEQYRVAIERVRARGLEGRVEVLLRDYRDLEGQYDKLVSIEMVEAVGHEFLETYLRACSEMLSPHGVMLLQAITITDQRHESHRKSIDFIKEYIFPGSCIPSVTTLVDAATSATDLCLVGLTDLTPHYARTLRVWRERLVAHADDARRLGFDERFVRMWEFYLAYCEGGFEERYLGSVHMLFAKPDFRRPPVIPAGS